MASKRFPLTLIAFFLSLALLPQSETSSCENFYAQAFQKKAFFFLSDEAPMTEALGKFPELVNAIDLILLHVARVENTTTASLQASNPQNNSLITPCRTEERGFTNAAYAKFGIRGWPPLENSCATDTYGVKLSLDEQVPYTVDDIFEAFTNRGKIITENIRSITNSIISNFSDPDFPYNWPFRMASRNCVLHSAAAYRIRDHWYLEHRITNKSKDDYSLYRHRIMEYHRVVDGKLEHMTMCLAERPEQGEVHVLKEHASTLLTTSFGPEDPFFFIESPAIDSNSALIRSQQQSDFVGQLAEDVLTPSNIAILILPMALNLVPLALISEVTTLKLLMYTVFSDILTVIPIGIKGVELIIISSQRHRSIFVRMASSATGERTESAAAQLHAAECLTQGNVRPTGVAFLIVSIVALVGGVAAEFVARHYMKKKRKHKLLLSREDKLDEMEW